MKKPPDPTRSKIARGAKRKGNRTQREVAKLLGLWFFNDERAFHSTPASGGLHWRELSAKTRGDVICSADEDFPYSIEVKNQERGEWDLLSILLNEGPIIKWWKQCKKDAEFVGRLPWLIFTRNNIPFMSMIKFIDGRYIGILPATSFKYDVEITICPLASLLIYNKPGSGQDPEYIDSKIIERHIINPLKRINKI